jgi:hypothetical protein
MNTALDRVLREALEDLVAEPPPSGLAKAAIGRARRQRATRVALAAAAVALVTGVTVPLAIAAVGGSAPDRFPWQEPAGPPAEKRLVVTAYAGITRPTNPSAADDVSALLDRENGRYEEIPYPDAIPSPDGTRAVVAEGDNSVDHPVRAGILDLATGQVRWIRGYGGYDDHLTWSPDGRQVLYSRRPKDGAQGFVRVDADTLRETFRPVPDDEVPNALGLGFVWAPDGRQVVHTLSVSVGDESEPDRVLGIRFYDLDGKPVRTLGLDDGVLLDGAGFSPDGSAMALGRRKGGDIAVVDSTDGTVRARVSMAKPGTVVVGWYDDSHLVLRSYADVDEWRQLVVVDLAGRRVRTVPLDGTWADAGRITLGPAEGLSPAAAGLAF